MDDRVADTEDRRQPSPQLRALLHTDFDGNPADPDDVVWRGQSADRFFSQDDTFGQLADATGSSLWLS